MKKIFTLALIGLFALSLTAEKVPVRKDFSTNIIDGTTIAQDSDLSIVDDGDTTKKAVFDASGISTGTTRTITLPNADGTIALSGATEDTIQFNTNLATPTHSEGLVYYDKDNKSLVVLNDEKMGIMIDVKR